MHLLGSLYLMHQVTELLSNAMTQVYNLHLLGNLYSQESSMVFPSYCFIQHFPKYVSAVPL